MPLSKLSELTSTISSNIPGMVDKMKSFVDSIAGTSKTAATEQALVEETDPLKAKILEVELLIHHLSDNLAHQQTVLNTLKQKYAQLRSTIEPKTEETVIEEQQAATTESSVKDNIQVATEDLTSNQEKTEEKK